MASSSSTKKAAKLAQKGKGQKIRFQGGTVFPVAVAIVLILGVALIAYSRQTLPAADATPPTIDDHWHAAYGFYLCDSWYQLAGNLEEQDARGQLINTNFLRTGIHSHDDGVIHWHPSTSRATGKNAVLGVFLDAYEVELGNDTLRFPSLDVVAPNTTYPPTGSAPLLQEYSEQDTKCDGERAELSVRVWDSFSDTGGGTLYKANMDRIHIDDDGMVFSIVFAPKDADPGMPPWAQDLPTLGELDGETEPINPADTLPVASTPDGSTPGSTPDGSTPGSTPDSTTTNAPTTTSPPATTAAPTTTGG